MTGAMPPVRRPDWALRLAFAVNIAALGLAIYCAVVIIALLYCFTLSGPPRCDPWTSHLPSLLQAISQPVLALAGTICGIRFARRGERKRAIRALLTFSALSIAALLSFALTGV
jgi:hypothetical protein